VVKVTRSNLFETYGFRRALVFISIVQPPPITHARLRPARLALGRGDAVDFSPPDPTHGRKGERFRSNTTPHWTGWKEALILCCMVFFFSSRNLGFVCLHAVCQHRHLVIRFTLHASTFCGRRWYIQIYMRMHTVAGIRNYGELIYNL